MWIEELNQRQGNLKIDVFYNQPGVSSTSNMQVWKKPFGCNYVFLFAVGGGGGGGRPVNDIANRGGGAGSGGGIISAFLPSFFIPDILYIKIGMGGLGSTTVGTIGAAGTTTLIGYGPRLDLSTQIIFEASAGQPGAALSSGGTTGAPLLYRGVGPAITTLTNGGTGTNGANSANGDGANNTISGGAGISSGGTGGGCGTGRGGNISSGYYPTILGGLGTNGGNGELGCFYNETLCFNLIHNLGNELPFIFSGGTGGGGHTTGQAGNGGHASYGGGGGGGGGCSASGGISGNGGNGGDGLVIIASY